MIADQRIDGAGGLMSKTNDTATNSTAAQRGLWRLLIKLPAVRGRLQLIAARSSKLNDIFEAYEEANSALERYYKNRDGSDCVLIEEYEALCSEIEADILRLVLEDGGPA